jgi:MFS transporter, putative metabolite:H+ symporter
MFDRLEATRSLTANQWRIIAAAILGDMLEFFDYFLIGFVLAFIVGPWQLSFGQSAIILLSSGIGAILGAAVWGRLADRIGRRAVFIGTVLNFSLATGILALTPDHGWIFLTIFRFFVGFGVGGLYCVDLPLVQEFVPASRRGFVGGLVTAFIPLGVLVGSILGAFLAPLIGWRGLFACGLVPALLTLMIRAWVPESPRWLVRMGRPEEARRSLAWALQVPSATLPLPRTDDAATAHTAWTDLFRYPRSLLVSWLSNLGMQTTGYGVILWAPTLFVMLLGASPAQASYLFIFVSLAGFIGRFVFSGLSELIGRRAAGALQGFGSAVMVISAGLLHDSFLGTVSVFWLLIIAADFFFDGGSAIMGPYAAEVWPSSLRTSGMGSAYGFGGIGKIIGPIGLALIVGSSNIVKPDVTIAAIVPCFLYLGAWSALAGFAYAFIGFETRGRSIEEIDRGLAAGRQQQVRQPARTMAIRERRL